MSVNLILRNDNAAEDVAHTQWVAIQAVSQNEWGMVTITDAAVTEIARILEDAPLSNGQMVTAYPMDYDDQLSSMVSGFGPCLLAADLQDKVRAVLAGTDNGTIAVALFDKMIEMGLQVSLNGSGHCDPYIKGVNWIADEVEINRTATNMLVMMRDELGLDASSDESGCGEVTFDAFAKAVNDNAVFTDMPQRLRALVECGRRQNATHVYWA